jgi:transposase
VAALDPFQGYAGRLRTQVPRVVRVLAAFHAARLRLAALDEVRRHVQWQNLHRRGSSLAPSGSKRTRPT